MTLTLRAVSLNDLPLTQPITARFDAEGGTIGRADHNTMALPDPERHISRQQAEIRVEAAGFVICNVGSANPITVAGQPVGQGQAVPLRHLDQVRIGGYLLEVQNERDEADSAMTVVRRAPDLPRAAPGVGGPSVSAGATAAARGFPGQQAAPLSSSNPFADLLGTPAQAPMGFDAPAPAAASPFATVPASMPTPAPPTSPALLPDDFDPFAPPAPRPAPPPAMSQASQASQAASPFDPFGGFDTRLPPEPPSSAPVNDVGFGGAFADLVPGEGNRSLDDLFGLQPSGSDPLAGFMAGATQGAGGGARDTMPSDPLALFGSAQAASVPDAEPHTPALPDHTPALHSSFRPPEVRTPPPPIPEAVSTPVAAFASPAVTAPAIPTPIAPQIPAPVMPSAPHAALPAQSSPLQLQPHGQPQFPAPPHAAPMPAMPHAQPMAAMPSGVGAASGASDAAAHAAALWAAFCEGAGVRMAAPPQGLNADLMRVIGQLLHASVDGALQMMAVRAATKHELRAQVTVIRSRENNPLKFSPDPQSALEQLLQPPVRGFLPGPAAMQDAMRDLVGHTIGTMAGTRAALEGVLTRFQPSALEAKLTGRSMLDSVLAMNRKAKLWELYLQHFESIRDEAQEDFHTLFGKAFLEAYEDQLERLNQRPGVAPTSTAA
ncbi:hypothetical protein CDN99_24455 [Roseateles aquatilis]|uniref:FHA domain-containing protein n=1 Tax=Roseateles aquatilis TaxID=431061 RepID=A0A246IW88_9BURK|nr:type VI secretion system-associated FHA domain protein TagH [Roseateles aquatilis]OWQ84444.1 hypothetical protein CDN99_24455 [Roseateles aquatilis]